MWALGLFYNSNLSNLIETLQILGDKIASSIIAQSANVPTMAWSGSRK